MPVGAGAHLFDIFEPTWVAVRTNNTVYTLYMIQ